MGFKLIQNIIFLLKFDQIHSLYVCIFGTEQCKSVSFLSYFYLAKHFDMDRWCLRADFHDAVLSLLRA